MTTAAAGVMVARLTQGPDRMLNRAFGDERKDGQRLVLLNDGAREDALTIDFPDAGGQGTSLRAAD